MTTIDRYELTDRYRLDEGRVFLSGSQALARLPLEQLRADRRHGLHTAAYVTGYPGSPLGNYDRDVAAVATIASADGYHLLAQPAMNEELAATAVMGSQLAPTVGSCRYDGVIGIWYGKAPGLHRASDALRHAVFAGTWGKGGAVALVGDDPNAKSSTLPSSSGATLIDLNMPLLFPGDVQEAIDLGRHAIAMSRAAGLWTSLKVVDTVADGSGTVDLHPDRITPIVPTMEVNGRIWVPSPSGHVLTPHTLELEHEFHEVRLELARRYAVMNQLNRVTVRGASDWIGIAASGQTYHETREALHLLGLRTNDDLRSAGIRLFYLGMPTPIDPAQVRDFAEGLHEVVVVEEKAQNLEWQVKDALYGRTSAPVVVGKRLPDGAPLFPFTGAFDADSIAVRLRQRLSTRLADRLTPPAPAPRQLIPLTVARTPYFCSGCPHNTSTQTPDGTLIGAGIGCHSMVLMMEPERAGHIVGLTAMGNEGAQWLGMAPFVEHQHLVQNLGDGTLFHSGMLAIRAAIATPNVNITYKILYNGAVSMTGGQTPVTQLSIPQLVKVLLAEGVAQVLITTDDRAKYAGIDLPDGVKVWGRDRIIEAQEVLARVPGCTVLIHDQRCAAELRRDRKRGKVKAPNFRVVINHRVCEGCGDCGDVSNCLSVQPFDTPFGRKTRIDQGSCNLDLSCMNGDCPSFATVRLQPARRAERAAPPSGLPAPTTGHTAQLLEDGGVTIRLTGIGGTGVVTVSQVLGTAAMLDGCVVRGLDQTGLSQKAGPVVSDLRISRSEPAASNRATTGSVDVVIAFDQLVAGADATMRVSSADRTLMLLNTAEVPTGSMVVHPDRPFPAGDLASRFTARAREQHHVDATRIVIERLGDDSSVNVFMLGVAVQRGAVPVSPEAIERAIELNGVAVQKNLAAFAWGRGSVVNPGDVASAAPSDNTIDPATDTGEALRRRLHDDLVRYQSRRYARQFDEQVARIAALGFPELTDTVARNLHKLMAYKDEYEVAALLLLDRPRRGVVWHLHPPVLRSLGMRRKLRLGQWATPLFAALRSMRRLRGTPLDVFGYATVRKVERALVRDYTAALRLLAHHTSAANVDEAVAIAQLPDAVRGYETLKLERAATFRSTLAERIASFSR